MSTLGPRELIVRQVKDDLLARELSELKEAHAVEIGKLWRHAKQLEASLRAQRRGLPPGEVLPGRDLNIFDKCTVNTRVRSRIAASVGLAFTLIRPPHLCRRVCAPCSRDFDGCLAHHCQHPNNTYVPLSHACHKYQAPWPTMLQLRSWRNCDNSWTL